jgi:hypothetical protein
MVTESDKRNFTHLLYTIIHDIPSFLINIPLTEKEISNGLLPIFGSVEFLGVKKVVDNNGGG